MKNLTMLADFYEFTMANGYFEQKIYNKIAYFDVHFRKIPDNGGFAIMSGLDDIINFLKNLKFTDADINFLNQKQLFSKEFLLYLKDFNFICDVWAIPEGTPIFPNTPILNVRGPILQAQFIETMILLTLNHQCLITTKANRMVRCADNRPVFEFGARRAHGVSAAISGSRASYIGGCSASSLTIADRDFSVPCVGTMAHSWVQSFDNEYDAFSSYAKIYGDNSVFLVDTYNVLKSGVPNAIMVNNKILKPIGQKLKAIRLDSGDIAKLSIESRKMLDDAGMFDTQIMVSNSLDEYLIRDLLLQNAKIDSFGVGERLITATSEPVFGGVYKLCAINDDFGNIIPKIKISENVSKITNPHFKQLYRIFDKVSNSPIADIVCLFDETIDDSKPITLFDPVYTWKKKKITNFFVKKLLVPIFIDGKCTYSSPSIHDIRKFCESNIKNLPPELLRLENPQTYYIHLSDKLWSIKKNLLNDNKSI